jgi:phosphate transport system substrate-binding protein
MRKKVIMAFLAMLVVAYGVALATDGKVLSYGGAVDGKVLFDGQMHLSKGYVCVDCHNDLFATKKEALITMEMHRQDISCFHCHNGQAAFNDCVQCHRKL